MYLKKEKKERKERRISFPCSSLFSSRCLRILIGIQLFLLPLISLIFLGGYHKDVIMYFSYLTRPLWDSSSSLQFTLLPHFYAEGVEIETLCRVNGWTYIGNSTNSYTHNKVVDSILFANELDLLEIRLRELYPVVDQFFIVESDKTFTDKIKPQYFKDNRERFAFAEDKIVYGLFVAPPVSEEEAKGFTLENKLRHFMTQLMTRNGVKVGDIVIMADVDEIPSRHTVTLFRHCTGYPSVLHLGMRNYLYSFEFPITHQAGYMDGSPSSYAWRPQVHNWTLGSYYKHTRSSDYLLVDAGWHCSFCFRFLDDFVFKMTSYSHSDRVRHENFLDPTRIQRIVCEGSDIFGMPAESYSMHDLLLNWYNPAKTQSSVHLPKDLVEHPQKYSFLLPGNCTRHVRI